MGRHLSINIRLLTGRFPEALCSALVSQGYFRLTSLGGIEGHDRGDHWFLCGYALEDLLDRFMTRATPKPASVETLVAADGSNRAYLEETSSRLQNLRANVSLSPFEKSLVNVHATFLDDWQIGSAEIAHCREWFRKYPEAILYFYGVMKLSAPSPKVASAPWHRAFREMTTSGQIGAPFLLVRAGVAPLAKGNFDITLRTESTLWLEGEENLARLVAVAETVLQRLEGHIASASLDLDGSPFLREESRLRAAFFGKLEKTCGVRLD